MLAARPIAADQDLHVPGVLGQVDHRLPRRIPAADHHDFLAPAEPRLHVGGRVVDARALELLEPRDVEPAVLDPAGDQHAARAEPRAVVQGDDAVAAVDAERAHRAGHTEARAEALRLKQRVPRELGARDPGGKPEIVLDPRARARLTARRERLGSEHFEPLRGGVHRRREPRGAGTDDHEIVHVIVLHRDGEPGTPREVGDGRIPDQAAVPSQDDRRLGGRDPERAEKRIGLLVGLEILEGERDLVP